MGFYILRLQCDIATAAERDCCRSTPRLSEGIQRQLDAGSATPDAGERGTGADAFRTQYTLCMRNPPLSDAAANSTSVAGLTVIEFITRLGDPTPAPGSGAAAAVALALAAACAAKAFAISQRHNHIEALAAATTRARELARIALEGAQHEGDDFRRWLKLHSAATAAALDEDSRGLCSLSASLRDLISSHRKHVIPSLTADLDAALELASSFDAIAKKNAMELHASAP
jgi:hypothetical protein